MYHIIVIVNNFTKRMHPAMPNEKEPSCVGMNGGLHHVTMVKLLSGIILFIFIPNASVQFLYNCSLPGHIQIQFSPLKFNYQIINSPDSTQFHEVDTCTSEYIHRVSTLSPQLQIKFYTIQKELNL